MKEVLLTSSVLILAVIILRLVFRSKVSRRLIYSAWLLVALRLLIPIQFGQLDFSVLSQAEPVTEVITDIAQKPVSGPSREEVYNDTLHDYISQGQPVFIPEVQEQVESEIQQSGRPAVDVYDEVLESVKPETVILPEVNRQIETVVNETISPTIGQIALVVWIAGMTAMAGWFVGVNLSFRKNLRRSATALPDAECMPPVKVSAAIASPCVFGLLRPVIYLTPNCVEDPRVRRHVLTHELTHLRHGDHIWAWVRCICLCVYWFNPLVWVAASLSKRDCELACDEAALKILGEDERLAYGKTLVDMVSSVPAPGQLLETATAMHETKKQLKERVKCIVKQPKVFLTAAITLLLVLTIVTGCTFSGAATKFAEQPSDTTTPTTEATTPTTEGTTPPTTVPPTTGGEEMDLEFFNALFKNDFANGERNGFYAATTHSYTTLDIMTLNFKYYFELGYPDEPEVTKAELDELAKIAPTGLQNYVCKRLPKDKVEAELSTVFGISLSRLRKVDLQGLYYLESTDSYYCFQTRPLSNIGFASALAVTKNDNNTISVLYTDGKQTDGEANKYMITLKPSGDSYHVLSNERIYPLEELQPTEPNPLADIPVITQTATLPANPTVKDLLLDPYTGSTFWYDAYDNEYDIDIELPLLVPFCDGAKAINQEIRDFFQPRIDSINDAYLYRLGQFEGIISYEAYLNGNVFSLIIIRDAAIDYNVYHTYNLDISTGKQLSKFDMIQRFAGVSYPEFLMHATYTVYDHMYRDYESKGNISNNLGWFNQLEHDAITMQNYELVLDADGTLILYNVHNSTFMHTVVAPYDGTAHGAEFSGGEKDAYRWLFTRQTDGAYADAFAGLLADSFFLAPESFLRYLSEMDDTTVQDIAGHIAYDLQPDEFDSFKTLCNQYLSNNATAKAAKALLDAFDKNH